MTQSSILNLYRCVLRTEWAIHSGDTISAASLVPNFTGKKKKPHRICANIYWVI